MSVTNTDVSNKNSSFFAALDKASEVSTEIASKEEQTQSGAMMVSKEQIQAQANKVIGGEEENQATELVEGIVNSDKNDIVKPREIKISCDHSECLKDFFNYLQDLGVIEIKEEFSIGEEFESFKKAMENLEPIHEGIKEKEPDEIIEEFKSKDFSDEDTFGDMVEDYAQAVANTIVSFNENFSTIESLGNFYNNDYMTVFNSEFDNALRACIELEVPEDMEDTVIDKAISIIAGEPEYDLESDYIEESLLEDEEGLY